MYESLLENERIEFAAEPLEVESDWLAFSSRGSASPKVWMDAYLAAFAKAGGYPIVTLDSAFERFDGVDLILING